MIKLIWRQIIRNKKQLLPIVLVWFVCGYFIFQYQNDWYAGLSRWWLNLPAPGTQNQKKALSYYIDAQERIEDNKIDLKLMNQSCENFLPIRFSQDIKEFRPHWLEKLRNWENQHIEDGNSLSSKTVEPDLYWSKNQGYLLESLKDIQDAMNYAWEISPKVHGIKDTKSILLPHLFSKYARALCQPALARLVWGDFAYFQEIRAWKKMEAKDNGNLTEYDFNRRTQLKIILRQLSGVPLYKKALQEYVAGGAPESGSRSCKTPYFRLSCISPHEAIEVYQKLILVVPQKEEVASFHLNLAKTAWYASGKSKKPKKLQSLAQEHFNYALLYPTTERETLFSLVEWELASNRPRSSYTYLKRLAIQSRQKHFPIDRFNNLARAVLIRLNRFEEADCYAKLRHNQYGTRKHCRLHRL